MLPRPKPGEFRFCGELEPEKPAADRTGGYARQLRRRHDQMRKAGQSLSRRGYGR